MTKLRAVILELQTATRGI